MCSNPTAIIYFPCYVEIISRDDTKKVVRKAVYTISSKTLFITLPKLRPKGTYKLTIDFQEVIFVYCYIDTLDSLISDYVLKEDVLIRK